MPKTNRLNICLIKPTYNRFDQIAIPEANGIEIPDVGTLYVEDSHPRPPDWIDDFFGAAAPAKLNLVTSSAKGVLLVRINGGRRRHIVAIVFGFGRHLLQEDVIEERFGLKVVLNKVNPESLRSIDKTSLGSIPKQTREQMSREGGASNFGIDVEQDLVNAVTGKSKDDRLGRTIAGRDALSVSVKVDATNIKEFLEVCLGAYRSNAYKAEFGWIDQIQDIRNQKKIDQLDKILVERIAAGEFTKIWMAPPEIVDWVDVKGFRYGKPKRGDLNDDLHVREFVVSLDGEDPTLEILKGTSVHLISSKTDEAIDHWSTYRCLYAEIEQDGKVCILNNGKWYEVVKDFTQQVKTDFERIKESKLEFPPYIHTDEASYNEALVRSFPGSCCMDRKMVPHGGGHSSVEFCDLLTSDKKLVHVKRYSGSSQLSHLFSQGVVSGELFVSDESFRRELNKKLPRGHKLADVGQQPDAHKYEVVFGIISHSDKPLDIPFFSKVSLRNASRRLSGFGYTVTKKKIATQSAGE